MSLKTASARIPFDDILRMVTEDDFKNDIDGNLSDESEQDI